MKKKKGFIKCIIKLSTFIAESSDTYIICSWISHFVKHWYFSHLSSIPNRVSLFCAWGQGVHTGCHATFKHADGTNVRIVYSHPKMFRSSWSWTGCTLGCHLRPGSSASGYDAAWSAGCTWWSCKVLHDKLQLALAITSQLESTWGRWYGWGLASGC